MMGITASGDVGLDAPLLTCRQGCGARIPSIQCRRLWHANRRWNGSERGFGFLRVVGVIREGPSDDEQTPLIHGHLRVVILLKSGIRRIFHDARLRVGKIVLVAVAGSWHRRSRRAAPPRVPRRGVSPRAPGPLWLILRPLRCPPPPCTPLPPPLCLPQPPPAGP